MLDSLLQPTLPIMGKLLSYAVLCVCVRQRVRKLCVNMLLVLWVVWAVMSEGDDVGTCVMVSDS